MIYLRTHSYPKKHGIMDALNGVPKMSNKSLHNAFMERNDEFYTRYEDVSNEMTHYDLHDKRIYLPCDTKDSAFWKYFTSMGYNVSRSSTYDYQYSGSDPVPLPNNSFDSPHSKAMMYECDVVITNPPFSRFRDLYDLIKSMDKRLLLVCPITAFNYSNIKGDVLNRRVWYGFSNIRLFYDPEGVLHRMNNMAWMTNIGGVPQHRYYFSRQLDDTYRYLDGTDILDIDRSKDYPDNYYGKVAVPISFLKHFDYDTFNILGHCDKNVKNPYHICVPYIDGRELFNRIVVQRKQ